jgi:hypothetical protein
MSFDRWLDRLFNKHKFVRRSLVFWAAALITYVILRVFEDLTLINANVTTALSLVVGLLATVIGFYNYQRKLEGGGNVESDSEGS